MSARLYVLDFAIGKNSLLISAITKSFSFFLEKITL